MCLGEATGGIVIPITRVDLALKIRQDTGTVPAADVHRATLVILGDSSAHVMSVEDIGARISAT